ncbi:hypothetical protein AB1Y20_007252 [Prymnesium parvum]|uniref:SNF2 N-terminal domain-containing protein n=1 Tax=Prymnesium parvum TaxID=97485 RepID=A0AB34IXE1_PRYPA
MDESHQNDSRGASQWCSQATQRSWNTTAQSAADAAIGRGRTRWLHFSPGFGAGTWRMHRHQQRRTMAFPGAPAGRQLLGDEPGLGKTFQVVVLADALISASLVQRALIVAPAEMETMWAAQFKKFLPRAALELTGLHRAVKNEYCAHRHTRGQIS